MGDNTRSCRGQETVNLSHNPPRSAFTDEVNYIIDNDK
jgi:hypothetical protein